MRGLEREIKFIARKKVSKREFIRRHKKVKDWKVVEYEPKGVNEDGMFEYLVKILLK